MPKSSEKKYVSPSIIPPVEQFKSLNLAVIEDEDIPKGEAYFIDKKQLRTRTT